MQTVVRMVSCGNGHELRSSWCGGDAAALRGASVRSAFRDAPAGRGVGERDAVATRMRPFPDIDHAARIDVTLALSRHADRRKPVPECELSGSAGTSTADPDNSRRGRRGTPALPLRVTGRVTGCRQRWRPPGVPRFGCPAPGAALRARKRASEDDRLLVAPGSCCATLRDGRTTPLGAVPRRADDRHSHRRRPPREKCTSVGRRCGFRKRSTQASTMPTAHRRVFVRTRTARLILRKRSLALGDLSTDSILQMARLTSGIDLASWSLSKGTTLSRSSSGWSSTYDRWSGSHPPRNGR